MKQDAVKSCKILMSCFVIQLLIAGAGRLSSIYFVESITRYNVDRKQASLPFILTYMVKNLSGPVIGYLEQIIGIKWIITLGCLMSTLSIGGCFFAEDILVITILWGVIQGFGFGFAFNLQAPLLSQHFKQNKSKANAFALVGCSIGGILLPLIAMDFIQTFGTSGSFLVLSAVIAHSIPASVLLENPSTHTKRNTSKENAIFNGNNSENKKMLINDSNNDESLYMAQPLKSLSGSSIENVSYENLNTENVSHENLNNKSISYRNCNHSRESIEFCTINSPTKILTPEIISKQKQGKFSKSFFDNKKFTLRNFRIFIDPTFIVILIIHGININVIVIVWTIILDFVRDKNVPENLEICYVILLPVTDILGRMVSGYVSDKNLLTFTSMCFITFLIKSITLTVIVHASNFILLMALEALLSICFGITVVLMVNMTDDFMEEDLKKMSQSCRVMLYAPLSLAVSPMLGYFRGGHGSYDNVFYILSGASLLCGCVACLLPYFSRRRAKLEENISI